MKIRKDKFTKTEDGDVIVNTIYPDEGAVELIYSVQRGQIFLDSHPLCDDDGRLNWITNHHALIDVVRARHRRAKAKVRARRYA